MPLRRRDFLARSAAAGLGLSLWPLGAASGASEPRVRRRVRLGRTGLEVPDIGFGGNSLTGDEKLVRHALDRGITHFDTAPRYKKGLSEETLGRALRGVRDQVVLTTKVRAEADERKESLMGRLEASLRRLQTDRIDIYHNHAVNDLARIRNPEWAEFSQRAKEQGKILWRGMSGHGGRLVECLDYALDHDLVDVVLVAFNFGQDPAFHEQLTRRMDFVATQPDLPRVLARAREKDVGIVAMKTLRGARLNDLRPYETGGATFAQAAFRWVLSYPNVDALVVSMKSQEMVDEYLGASGWTRTASADGRLLLAYEGRNAAGQCRYGCSACADACPHGVPVPEVLRTRMYDRDYADRALAREDYARLTPNAAACLACTGAPCAGACPFGLRIDDLTRDAARRLG